MLRPGQALNSFRISCLLINLICISAPKGGNIFPILSIPGNVALFILLLNQHIMRLITFLSLLILSLDCGSTGNLPAKPNELNGTWIPVKQEMGGKPWPAAMFEKQKLIVSDSLYTFIAESVDKGELKYGGGKMDIYGKEGVNAGKHFTAIYKYENEQLTICYNLAGDTYPEGFETKSKSTLFLSVFKKEVAK
jgi:uncharacterized protein (TIGR03067 family)